MFAKITKIKIEGHRISAIFFDKDTTQMKTIYFGAAGNPDYTKAPHDEERNMCYIKRHNAK